MLVVPTLLARFFFTDDSLPFNAQPELLFALVLALPYLSKFIFLPVVRSKAFMQNIRGTLIACVSCFALGNFLTALSIETTLFPLLLIGQFINGIGGCGFYLMLLSSKIFGFDRKKSLRVQGYGITAGPLIGALSILPGLEIETPFYIITILSIISMSFFLFSRFPKKSTLPASLTAWNLKELGIEDIATLTCAFLFAHTGWKIYFYDVPLFAFKVYSFSLLHIILLLTIFCLGLQIGLNAFSLWVRSFGRKGLAIAGHILVALFMMIETAPKHPGLLWGLAFPLGLSAGIAYTSTIGMYHAIAEKRNVKNAEIIAYTTQALATCIGITLVGILSHFYKTLPFIIAFLLLAVGISFLFLGTFSKTDKENVF